MQAVNTILKLKLFIVNAFKGCLLFKMFSIAVDIAHNLNVSCIILYDFCMHINACY